MKKIIGIMASALIFSGAVFAKPFVPANPSALVGIKSNEMIDWYGETAKGGTGLLQYAAKAKISKDADEDTQAKFGFTSYLMDDARDIAYEVLQENGITLIDEETVIGCESYKNAEDNKMMKLALFVQPENYKLLGNKDAAYPEIASETGAAGLISITYSIQKNISNGVAKNGKMKACVTSVIEFMDANGKVLKQVNGYASSEEQISVVGGIYDAEKLYSFYPEVIKASLNVALGKLKK